MEITLWIIGGWIGASLLLSPLIGRVGRLNDAAVAPRPADQRSSASSRSFATEN